MVRPASLSGLVITLMLVACKSESKHDLYMQGMKIEGEASRGECQLVYDPAEKSHVLDGDKIEACLDKTAAAIERYERAEALGMRDADFVQTYERALDRRTHLQAMLKTVRGMERPEGFGPGTPPS